MYAVLLFAQDKTLQFQSQESLPLHLTYVARKKGSCIVMSHHHSILNSLQLHGTLIFLIIICQNNISDSKSTPTLAFDGDLLRNIKNATSRFSTK